MHSPVKRNCSEADSTTEEPELSNRQRQPCYRIYRSSSHIGFNKALSVEKPIKKHESSEVSPKEKIDRDIAERKIVSGNVKAKPCSGGRDGNLRVVERENRSSTSSVSANSRHTPKNFGPSRSPGRPVTRLNHIQMNPVWFYPNLLMPASPGFKQYSSVTGYNQISHLNNFGYYSYYSNYGGSAMPVKNFAVPSYAVGFAQSIKTLNSPCQNVLPSGRTHFQDDRKTVGRYRPMMCNFCKNNKEVPDIYLNHYLYDPQTKILTCPVLRKHVCQICGETGDRAHTLQYCPVYREKGLPTKVPVLLKTRTITNSTGKIRRN